MPGRGSWSEENYSHENPVYINHLIKWATTKIHLHSFFFIQLDGAGAYMYISKVKNVSRSKAIPITGHEGL
jgi:hypothetical protein